MRMLPSSKDDADLTDEVYYPVNLVDRGPASSDELEREIEFIRKQPPSSNNNNYYTSNDIIDQQPRMPMTHQHQQQPNRRVVLPDYYRNLNGGGGELYESEDDEEPPVYGTIKKTYKPEKKTSAPRRISDNGDVYLRSRRRSYNKQPIKGIDALRELMMKKNKR